MSTLRQSLARRLISLAGIVLALFAAPPLASGTSREQLQAGIDKYREGQVDEALTTFMGLANAPENPLSSSEEIILHKYLGFCFVEKGDIAGARNQFRDVLTLDPAYQLDRVKTSPKIVTLFEEVKAEMVARAKPFAVAPDTMKEPDEEVDGSKRSSKGKAASGSGVASKTPVSREITPVGALWRSGVAPGWGQWVTGRRNSGLVYTGGVVVTLGMALHFTNQAGVARGFVDDYAEGTSERDQAEKQVTLFNILRLASIGTCAAIWGGNMWDAYQGAERGGTAWRIAPISGSGPGLTLIRAF